MGLFGKVRAAAARIDGPVPRRVLEERLKRARLATKLAAVGNVTLYDDRVVIAGNPPERLMLSAETVAYVDTAGGISSRVTATRLVALGPFALAAKKKRDDRELYLYVEDPAGVVMAPMPADQALAARQLTVALANAARNLEVAKATRREAIAAAEAALNDETPPA